MKNSRYIALLIGVFVCILAVCSTPFVLAKATGQFCLDFMSGQVPDKAEKRYFNMLFTAVKHADYKTVSELVSSEEAVDDLRSLQSVISTNYQVVWGDDLATEYEREFLFDNGQRVYLSFYGAWRDCPDFDITDEEIRSSIQLYSIELMEAKEE